MAARIKLGELCHVVTKGTTPTSLGMSFADEGVPFLRIQNLRGSEVKLDDVLYIDNEVHQSLSRSIIKPKDFLITIAGTIGRVAIVPDEFPECNCNQAIAILRFDNERLDARWLYHWLSTSDAMGQIAGKKVTATISNLSLGQIKDLGLPLPYPDDPEKSLKEQKRIAAILDKADGIRRKRKQAIQLADDFLRSVFLDMFGDPVTNPKGWEVKKWEDCLRIVNGKNQKKVESENGEYPICGSGGLMSKANDWLVEKNSVIIGRKGNINSPILMKERFWNVDTAFGLEPKLEQLSHNYLFWFCKFFNFERLNKAVTIPSLTKADLLNVELPLPNINLQKEFDSVVDKVDVYLEKAFDFESNKSFEALSQKAFKGEL